MMGTMLGRVLATLMRSRPGLWANSTAYTKPFYLLYGTRVYTGPTISDTWETVVPDAAPKYSTLLPGSMKMLRIPPYVDEENYDSYNHSSTQLGAEGVPLSVFFLFTDGSLPINQHNYAKRERPQKSSSRRRRSFREQSSVCREHLPLWSGQCKYP